jgi:hypothetical protein
MRHGPTVADGRCQRPDPVERPAFGVRRDAAPPISGRACREDWCSSGLAERRSAPDACPYPSCRRPQQRRQAAARCLRLPAPRSLLRRTHWARYIVPGGLDPTSCCAAADMSGQSCRRSALVVPGRVLQLIRNDPARRDPGHVEQLVRDMQVRSPVRQLRMDSLRRELCCVKSMAGAE